MTDYEKICDFENLYKAHKRARCCKRHKKDVILFEMNLAENLWNIKNSLENRTYKVAGYNKFMIFDPKQREIQALSYYDRIVQHVLCDEVLTPFFDKRLIYDNCACRIGKGTHFALKRLTQFFQQHYKKLRCSSKIRFKNRLKKLQYGYKTGRIQLDDINMSLASYYGHLKHGNTYKLRTSVFSKFKFSKLG